MLAATAAAAAAGVVAMVSGSSEPGDVKLRPGDLAPDFTLPGSDGRTDHPREIVGHGHGGEIVVPVHVVVIAWFPKARGPGGGGGSLSRRDGVRKQRAGRREAAAW